MRREPDLSNPLYSQFLGFRPSKGDVRRAKILEATIRLIGREGIEAMSFEAVGKMLKMGRAHVAYYFKDRDELVVAAIKFAVGTAQGLSVEAVKNVKEPKAQLNAFIEANARWVEEFPEHASLVLLLYYSSSFDQAALKLNSEIRKLGQERITALLRLIYPTLTIERAKEIARSIQAIMTGHFLEWATTEPKPSKTTVLARVQYDVNAILQHLP